MLSSLARYVALARQAAARWLDAHTLELLWGSLTVLPIRAIGTAAGFALNVLLAKLLGAEGAGVYFLAMTVTTFGSAIGTFGLGNVLVRHTAAGVARDDLITLKATTLAAARVSLACAGAVTLLLVVLAPWLCDLAFGKPELTTPLQWMSLTIVPQTQLRLHAQVLRGLNKIALSQILRNVDVPLLNLGFLAVLGGVHGVTGAVWAFVVANLITAAMASWIWRRALGPVEADAGSIDMSELVRSGLPLMQANLMNLMLTPLTTLMLGTLSTSSAVAIFAVAFRTTNLTRFALMGINAIAAPKFAALHGTGDSAALATTARSSTWLIALASIPMLLPFLVFPAWTMGLFGEAFVAGAGVLLVLSLGQFVTAISGSVGHLLMMSGNERLLRNNILVSSAACLALNLALIPEFHAMGAAISVSASLALRSVLGSLQVYRALGILPIFVRAPAEVADDVQAV